MKVCTEDVCCMGRWVALNYYVLVKEWASLRLLVVEMKVENGQQIASKVFNHNNLTTEFLSFR